MICIIQKNEKINILSVPIISLNFSPSWGTKKGSDECHFDHFTNIFWVKRTLKIFSVDFSSASCGINLVHGNRLKVTGCHLAGADARNKYHKLFGSIVWYWLSSINFVVLLINRYHSRFFVQLGHETTYASSWNKHFFH